jgi:hypothetical protein
MQLCSAPDRLSRLTLLDLSRNHVGGCIAALARLLPCWTSICLEMSLSEASLEAAANGLGRLTTLIHAAAGCCNRPDAMVGQLSGLQSLASLSAPAMSLTDGGAVSGVPQRSDTAGTEQLWVGGLCCAGRPHVWRT